MHSIGSIERDTHKRQASRLNAYAYLFYWEGLTLLVVSSILEMCICTIEEEEMNEGTI